MSNEPCLWVRSEVFDHGVIPTPRSSNVTTASLRDLVSVVRSPAITYSQWVSFAADRLQLTEEQAATYMELYQCFRLQPLTRITTANGVETAVDLLELVIFMFIQSSQREAQPVAAADDRWPGGPADGISNIDGGSPRARERRRVQNLEQTSGRLHFVRSRLGDLLHLASFQGTFSDTIKPHQLDRLRLIIAGRSPSSDEEVHSLCSLAPFWRDNSTTAVPCDDVARWIVSTLGNDPELCISVAVPSPGRSSGVVLQRVQAVQQTGIERKTVLLNHTDIDGAPLVISDCSNSYIYVLAHTKYAAISGCRDCLVVIGATSAVVTIDNCENVNFVGCCGRITVSNTVDSILHLCTSTAPVLHGDCRNVQFAPFNTFYTRLETDLTAAGIDPQKNEWDNLGTGFLPHDSSAAERAICILPAQDLMPVAIPFGSLSPASANPVPMASQYVQALSQKQQAVMELKDRIVQMPMADDVRVQMHHIIQARFKEWLVKSGNIRQVGDLVEMEGKNQQGPHGATPMM